MKYSNIPYDGGYNEALDDFIDAYEVMMVENYKLKKALEFYADKENWFEEYTTEAAICIVGDSAQEGRDVPIGGKLAREVLKGLDERE